MRMNIYRSLMIFVLGVTYSHAAHSIWVQQGITIEIHPLYQESSYAVLNAAIESCHANRSACLVFKGTKFWPLGQRTGDVYDIYFSTTPPPNECTANSTSPECIDDGGSCPGSNWPIAFSSGRKYLDEIDFQSGTDEQLYFSRSYNYAGASTGPVRSYRDLWALGGSDFSVSTAPLNTYYKTEELMTLVAQKNVSSGRNFQLVGSHYSKHKLQVRKSNREYKVELGSTLTTRVNADNEGFTFNKYNRTYSTSNTQAESYELKSPRNGVVRFDAKGRIKEKIGVNGSKVSYEYSNGATDATDFTITDHLGGVITLVWQDTLHAVMTNPDNQQTHYFFDPDNVVNPRLKVVFPDATPNDLSDNPTTEYEHISAYDNSGNPTLLNGALKAVYENGTLVAEYEYDPTTGRAIHEHLAGGVESLDIDYQLTGAGRVQRATTTNALGKNTVYHFDTIGNSLKLAHIEGQSSISCAASDSYRTYDANGFRHTNTDANGNVNETIRNQFGQVTFERDGLAWSAGVNSSLVETPDSKSIETDWHTTFNLPSIRIHRDKAPSSQWQDIRQEAWDYDNHANLRSYTETDLTNHAAPYATQGRTRVTTIDYTFHDTAQTIIATKTVNGPLNPTTQPDGVDDITVYTYNAQAQLTQTRNAYGHVVRYQDYLNSGKPQTIIDANNVVTRLAYTPRGYLDRVTVETNRGNAITDYDYYLNGLLQKVTLPNGSSLTYEYNDAKQLTAVVNNLGERIELTPSLLNGEWSDFAVKNASGSIIRLHERVQDELGRVKRLLRPDASTDVEYWYDGEGNLDSKQSLVGPSVSSPTIVETDFNYNALNQLSETIDARNASTKVDHDGEGGIASVTDARNNKTTYVRDGFGQVIRLQSPDSGTTDFWYDAAGNLLSKRDGRGVTTSYTYDALSRQRSEQYSNDSSLNVTLQYDQTTVQGEPSRGIGRLAALLRTGANVYYVYDDRGNVAADIHTIGTVTYATRYVYDRASMLETMTYPSGRTYIYAYDTVGRIKTLSVKDTPTSTAVQLARSVTYEPFGPLKGFIHRNNIQHDRLYDTQGRLRDITEKYSTTTYQNQHFDYDWAGNIERINDLLTPTSTQVFGYSEVDRLLNASGSYGVQAFTYDLVGNRQTANSVLGTNSVNDIYTIATGSNRLSSHSRKVGTATPVVKSFAYNGAGNATTTSTHTITYDGANRIKTARKFSSTTLQFTYNALGQRVSKWVTTTPSVATHFHYDLSGKLIAETNATGATVRDYVWLGDQLVAIQSGAVASTARYSVHSNHLNAPVLITNSSRGTVWKAEYEPYGTAKLLVNSFANNLRFPGQYFDSETGLHYNYFRTYDPQLGRYLQSDPIGLEGGINTYAYVGGNPVNRIDPLGLADCHYSIGSHTIVCTSGDGQTQQVGPDNVFSGTGPDRNNIDSIDNYRSGPVPPGTYDMIRTGKYGGSYWLKEGWLDRQFCKAGLGRCEFYMHKGSISEGCITASNRDPGTMDQWDDLMEMLDGEDNNTMTVTP